MLPVQFLLVLSAYKTSHQWLQHPSNTVNTLCGSDLGAAQAEGYLWWPDAGNTALSYCVQACPQAAGDQSLIISFLVNTTLLFLQEAGHGLMCLFNNASFLLGPTYQYALQNTFYTQVACLATLLCHCQFLEPGAGSICVNTTSYIASTADGCIWSTTVLYSTYNSIDYFGYCLPSDTTSAAWDVLHATIDRPAVSLYVCS